MRDEQQGGLHVFKAKAAFSGFAVDDLATARTFYTDTLGLQVDEEGDGMGIRLQLPGGGTVFVYDKADHQPASFTMLNCAVDNIDEAVGELTGRGVQFEHYDNGAKTDDKGTGRGGAQNMGPDMEGFKDPAGNFLSV